ncbi:FtsK/SpoIIIE family protein [Paraburkholderia unamae]|uniref:FtsK/SpoIIIE domain-containing protein n=1 Tax=Paraburkholderia unamae TaxID=219649 RepID=UPI000DC26F56|nr:FtsK/SpoIIIE domain-containing protein [Paraburkholderia unamae]RAR66997.1 FtsK/SpoIIIE family protein [Paraburkholderia unamae]
MSDISISQVLSSRYRTSGEADRMTNSLMNHLGLSTRANVARLAIGRSLGLGALPPDGVDAKGFEIPAQILFSSSDIAVWVGLIVAHTKLHTGEALRSVDALRTAVRLHWHRGVRLLMDDWIGCDEDYDRFVETLINRRASLPDTASRVTATEGGSQPATKSAEDVSSVLINALADMGITAEPRGLTHGPRLTRYKLYLPDVNHFSKLKRGLEQLALGLGLNNHIPTLCGAEEARTIYLDIPRAVETWTYTGFSDLREWIKAAPTSSNQLLVFPGVDVLGRPFSFNLAEAPHLLIGGATGMGKSVCVHSLIASLVLQHSPTTLKLALIDPKQVEFSVYQGSPFLFGGEIVSTPSDARSLLQALVQEMDVRYEQFTKIGVANIAEARAKGVSLPFVAVFIEELADLILQSRDVENSIIRLAQKARAAGIHLILATQRPDAKTFSGLVRSNIPSRIALTVQKASESTIILDETGAESLLGKGDMLIRAAGRAPERVHGVYVGRTDLESIIRERRDRP